LENWATRYPKERALTQPLESVWQAKREYRAELAKKRALRFLEYRKALPQFFDLTEAVLSTSDASTAAYP
jgi:hypothetical protein